VPPGAEDDFEVFSNDSLISQFKSFTLTVRIGVAVVQPPIALVAAGIGIMNIMLVSVTERTARSASDARRGEKRNIMTQFIMEAIVLCEVGGVIGVALQVLGAQPGGLISSRCHR